MSDDPNDALNLIDDMQPFIESLRGMVAVFIAEGYTNEQARDLVVCLQKHAAKATT